MLYEALEIHGDVIDCIITNFDIEETVFVPVIKVGLFLTAQDFTILDKEGLCHITPQKYRLSDLMNIYQKSPLELMSNLKEFFGDAIIDDLSTNSLKWEDVLSSVFIQKVTMDTWENLIRHGGGILEKHGYITPKYIDDLVDSVRDFSMYMSTQQGVLIPHTLANGNVLKTGFSLLILDKPIIFPNNQEITFILTIASHDNESHKRFFMALFNILNESKYQEYIKTSFPEDIYQFLTTSQH